MLHNLTFNTNKTGVNLDAMFEIVFCNVTKIDQFLLSMPLIQIDLNIDET